MKDSNQHDHNSLLDAYQTMLSRVRANLQEGVDEARPHVRNLIENAREQAVSLGEITREEADKVGDYLRRDLQDAAEYIEETRTELAEWFRFDMKLIEERLLDMFSHVTDATRLELDKLKRQADLAEWHTGEITGPGTLRCDACEHELHFHKVGHIPPCSKCHATRFHRVRET